MPRAHGSEVIDGGHRAFVRPIPAGIERPRWSVMIPTHNCAHYLRETLECVLEQYRGPQHMQIEVVDDASDDDPERVVQEVGKGRVGFHRQARNVGHTRNFETCLERSRGEIVHLLHGDDAVRPGFYGQLEQPLLEDPALGAAFCRFISQDSDGHWQHVSELLRRERGVLENWLERIAVGQALQTPSIVVRREVYERLGGFDRRLAWTEDWEMWVRIAAHYPVWYETEPLALYRVHSRSNTGSLAGTAGTIRDVRLAIEINANHLPAERRERIHRDARAILAATALRRARRLRVDHTWSAVAHALEAVRTRQNPSTVVGAGLVLASCAIEALRKVRQHGAGA